MSELIGRSLGQYQIVEQIGQGGMATVFKAYQPNLDRYVALKILPPIHAEQDGFSQRFQREAKTIANLNHPHILPVYDFGQEDDYSFLTMRYIENAHTLRSVMDNPLSLSQVADLIGQVASALDAAHQKGIVHRDVKPSNVLMDGEWALLGDFGLAKMVESSVKLTGTGVGIGTPAYMSPEQGQGREVDHRTDIYALGIILFEMLTGKIPHEAETPIGIVLKRLTEPLPMPRSLNGDIPEAVERVILKALAREPDNRFVSAGELAEALKVAVSGSSLETVPLGEKEEPTVLSPEIVTPKPALSQVEREPTFGRSLANLLSGGKDEQRAQQNRQAMLKLVDDFWVKGVLENSLHGAALIELGLEARPEAVDHPWEMVLQTPNLPHLSIPSGTQIVDVFNELGRSLLILGEPGAGKTTMLLELARDLINRANQDPNQPIPVVFNLSSWSEAQSSLAEWLVDELNTKYNIPKKIARPWVENDDLILLLDGLDEVASERRDACVEAINAFRQEHLVPIVVCSRITDYEALTERLKLQGAVLVQPLTTEQIDYYLDTAGPDLATVRTLLQKDSLLKEMTQSPLMLSIMTLAYRGLSAEDLPSLDTFEGQRKHLFETYVQQMFERRGADERYSPQQTTRWLSWLAQGMSEHSHTIFLIERLQPSWLQSRRWRIVYILASRFLGGVGVGLSVAQSIIRFGSLIGRLVFGLSIGLIAGLAVSLIDILHFEWLDKHRDQAVVPPLRWSLINIAVIWLAFGSLVWLIIGLSEELTASLDAEVIVVIGLFYGLIFGLIFGLRGSRQSLITDIQTVETLRWYWGRALKGGFIGLIIGPIFVLIFVLVLELTSALVGLNEDFIARLNGGLIFGLIGGLIGAVFYGLSGRIIETKFVPNRGIRLSVRKTALAGMMSGLSVGLLAGLGEGVDEAINYVLVLWLLGGLIGAVFYGLGSETVETKTATNQGIRLSTRNAVFAGLLVGLPVGLLTGLSGGDGLSLGPIFGLLAALWYGGLDVIQHYTLRLILWGKGYLPWNVARFLDYAAERVFLRKVGGGYIFVHRLLLEYFAKLA